MVNTKLRRALSRMFDGLRSEWQMRFACMYCMPAATSSSRPRMADQRRGSRRKRPASTASRRLPPLQNSCNAMIVLRREAQLQLELGVERYLAERSVLRHLCASGEA
jgi:hypothetical protein